MFYDCSYRESFVPIFSAVRKKKFVSYINKADLMSFFRFFYIKIFYKIISCRHPCSHQ